MKYVVLVVSVSLMIRVTLAVSLSVIYFWQNNEYDVAILFSQGNKRRIFYTLGHCHAHHHIGMERSIFLVIRISSYNT